MPPRLTGLWRYPDFLKLWLGQTVSEIGSHITREGLPLTAVIVLGATPFPMGVLASLSGMSTLVFGPLAGLWVDRRRRRPILIAADIGRAVVLASVPLAAAFRVLYMRQLYIVVVLAGILTVFFDVAYQSYLPSLVERQRVLEGNSKLALSTSMAEIVGPGLTGVLVQLITAPIAILVDALSFLWSAMMVWLIRKPELIPAPQAERRFWHRQFLHRFLSEPVRPLRDPISSDQPRGAGRRDRSRWGRKHARCSARRAPGTALRRWQYADWVDAPARRSGTDGSSGAWLGAHSHCLSRRGSTR